MNPIQTENFNEIFDKVVDAYHIHNDIFFSFGNPYPAHTLEHLLFEKCLIDTRQWHMEDEVRNPSIDPSKGMEWKRLIDRSNQERTDIVERIDDYFFQRFTTKDIPPHARLNTESPAWAIDRLSILALKIYHMHEETQRTDADEIHIQRCMQKLELLLQQRKDLTLAIDELLDDYHTGKKYMKVYRQVKMYNDPALNPVLYKKKK